MKRLIFSSLSILLLSTAISPTIRAEVYRDSHAQNQDDVRQGLIAQNQETSEELMANADHGTPKEMTQEEWLAATGSLYISEINPDSYSVTVEARNLVPNGLYTLWWVKKKLSGMDMGPAGGVPDNEFRADSKGNAMTTISVPADNDYQMLVAAYHADDQTHGQMPGEMGEITFGHLKGNFPKLTK